MPYLSFLYSRLLKPVYPLEWDEPPATFPTIAQSNDFGKLESDGNQEQKVRRTSVGASHLGHD